MIDISWAIVKVEDVVTLGFPRSESEGLEWLATDENSAGCRLVKVDNRLAYVPQDCLFVIVRGSETMVDKVTVFSNKKEAWNFVRTDATSVKEQLSVSSEASLRIEGSKVYVETEDGHTVRWIGVTAPLQEDR